MTGYELSRRWFNFCFDNPEKISPNHSAIFFFAIEHCNRLGWKKKFSFPTTMAKDAIGIKSYNTYIKCFNELVEWGFIDLIQKSENQYSANIIALSNFDKPLDKSSDKSLDKAMINHLINQSEITEQTNDSIIKPQTTNQYNHKPDNNKQDLPSAPTVPPYLGKGQKSAISPGAENFGDISAADMYLTSTLKKCQDLYFESAYFEHTREELCVIHHIDDGLLKDWSGVFVVQQVRQGKMTKSLADFASHFSNWLPKQDFTKTPKQALEYEQRTSTSSQQAGGRGTAESIYAKLTGAGSR